MCYIVLPQTPVRKLLGAAANINELLGNGTLSAACSTAEPEATARAVVAFDQLTETANAVCNEIKGVSPFLRFRREILATDEDPNVKDIPGTLRQLVLNLWGGEAYVDLGFLFRNADEHHTRIALELITSYRNRSDLDPHFVELAREVHDIEKAREAA